MRPLRQVPLGLIGFGEVGFNLARGLRTEGLADIAVFDPAGVETARRADEAGVVLVDELRDVADRSEIVLGLTPGSQSVASARALAGHLGPDHVYVDLASATPRLKIEAADLLRECGVLFGDGSIMGGPLIDGHRVEIIASGPAAPALRDALSPWGMNITVVSGQPGAASAIKIFRSVIAKGLEALLLECLLATEQFDISDAVLASYGRFLASKPFEEMAGFLVRTDVIHAARRAEEAAMSAEALLDAGVDPVMTRATVARLSGVAALGLREAFAGQVPAHYPEAVAAIAARLLACGPEPD